MKRKDVVPLWDAVNQLEKNKYNIKFSYFLAKLKLKLRQEIETLNGFRTPDPEYLQFDRARLELARNHSEKDEKGNPKTNNGNFIIQNHTEFDKEINILLDKHKDCIKNFEDKLKKFTDIMNEEYSLNFDKLDMAILPEMIEPNIVELFINCNLIN